jgi:hypothetical protein
MCSSILISSSSLNLMVYNPTRTTSANHTDLLQYLLILFISAGQHPFILPPFATSLPQSESKVASTQSKQGINEGGVEAMLLM